MGEELAKVVSRRVRELRKERGWSQRYLADMLGINGGMPSQYETGARTPAAETLVKLANAFGVTTDYLLGLSNKR